MSMRKIHREIAKKDGVSVAEVKREYGYFPCEAIKRAIPSHNLFCCACLYAGERRYIVIGISF